MQTKTTEQDFWGSNAPVTSPHFDQEATLLSARPVVPIDELSNRPRRSRAWFVGFGLAGMLLLGVSATALYYSRLARSESQPIQATETVSSGIQGFASNLVDEPRKDQLETIQPPNMSRDTEQLATAKPDKMTAANTRPVPKSSNPGTTASRRRSAEIVVDESADSEEETREERRAARREAKEQKRAERRWRTGRRPDGVLRIREIFEGSPRP